MGVCQCVRWLMLVLPALLGTSRWIEIGMQLCPSCIWQLQYLLQMQNTGKRLPWVPLLQLTHQCKFEIF